MVKKKRFNKKHLFWIIPLPLLIIILGFPTWFILNQTNSSEDNPIVSAYLCRETVGTSWNDGDFTLITGKIIYSSCEDAHTKYLKNVANEEYLLNDKDSVTKCTSSDTPCECYTSICKIDNRLRMDNVISEIEFAEETNGNIFNQRILGLEGIKQSILS